MGVLLPNGTEWDVQGWVATGFLTDAKRFTTKSSLLAYDIDVQIGTRDTTLDLRRASREQLAELAFLVDRVLEKARGIAESGESTTLPTYVKRLEELVVLVARARPTT